MNAGVRWMSKRWPKRRQESENVSWSTLNGQGDIFIFAPELSGKAFEIILGKLSSEDYLVPSSYDYSEG